MPGKSPSRARSTRLPTGREARTRAGATTATERLMGLQGRVGNRALGRLIGGGAPPSIGRSDSGEERRADRAMDRVMRGAVGRARPRSASAPSTPGLGGGRVMADSTHRRLQPHFGVDLKRVRLHAGRDVDRAMHAVGAEGFSYGRDVFLRSDKADPRSRSGLSVLSHELGHVDADARRGGRPVLRRKAGLPTASEAHKEADGSGAGWFFKGEWGTYRRRLDKFRAVPDKNTARQAELLLKLQDSSQKILDSTRWEAKKKKFVREQIPKIKKLYYEVALKGDVFDTIESEASEDSENQKGRLDTAIKARMKRLKAIKQRKRWLELKKLGTAPLYPNRIDMKTPEAPDAQRLVQRIATADLTMNFEPESLKYFIADSDVKQFWQLRSDEAVKTPDNPRKGKIYADGRDRAEQIMGYGSMYDKDNVVDDKQRPNRPISCAINVFRDPKGGAAAYGKWHFKLKDEVKRRATYLSGDSIEVVKPRVDIFKEKRVDHIGTVDHLEGVLASSGYMLDALVMDELGVDDLGKRHDYMSIQDGDKKSVMKSVKFDKYIEVQVHGGLSIDDIDYLVVDVPESKSARKSKDEIAHGALVDQWLAAYPSKARVRYI